ncbi:hypothetical protein [Paenibacillus thalictri]|uniref:Uncharacterized protein n=1 Tax=Paenibacillus thalictri TaxID=2527873 RepID=A0A4Q9DPJ0_9BACL|nr:hypothetical protein [Paenibacillus thalictri]TBL78225.1 hypothetical protein EYB31_15250 [Paenibacillus thalictri]
MITELLLSSKKIPVSFISCDQKAIPQLIRMLQNNEWRNSREGLPEIDEIEHIELVGNHAILHSAKANEQIHVPLY